MLLKLQTQLIFVQEAQKAANGGGGWVGGLNLCFKPLGRMADT